MSSPHAADVIRQGGGQSLTRESWTKGATGIPNFLSGTNLVRNESSGRFTQLNTDQT